MGQIMNLIQKKMTMKNTTNNSVAQVGGTHYRGTIQPWDEIMRLHFNWAQGEILKYLCRHPYKGKEQDLRKAISIAEKAKLCHIHKPADLLFGEKYDPDFIEQYTQVYGDDSLFGYFQSAVNHVLTCKWDQLIDIIQRIIKRYYGNEEN
jgi:hypothetical protein